MPRHEGNRLSSHRSRSNHKPMHSGRHGRGLDRKLKLAKQQAGQDRKPARKKREPA